MNSTYRAALTALQAAGCDLAAAHAHTVTATARLGESVVGTETTFSRYARCEELGDLIAGALELCMRLSTVVEADLRLDGLQ